MILWVSLTVELPFDTKIECCRFRRHQKASFHPLSSLCLLPPLNFAQISNGQNISWKLSLRRSLVPSLNTTIIRKTTGRTFVATRERRIIDRFHLPDLPSGRHSSNEAVNNLNFKTSAMYNSSEKDWSKVVSILHYDIPSYSTLTSVWFHLWILRKSVTGYSNYGMLYHYTNAQRWIGMDIF